MLSSCWEQRIYRKLSSIWLHVLVLVEESLCLGLVRLWVTNPCSPRRRRCLLTIRGPTLLLSFEPSLAQLLGTMLLIALHEAWPVSTAMFCPLFFCLGCRAVAAAAVRDRHRACSVVRKVLRRPAWVCLQRHYCTIPNTSLCLATSCLTALEHCLASASPPVVSDSAARLLTLDTIVALVPSWAAGWRVVSRFRPHASAARARVSPVQIRHLRKGLK